VKPLWVFEFQIVILYLQLLLNFNCSLEESLILLLNALIILIKFIVLVYNVLSMEGRWNVWNPWYLLPEDKLGKVECKFYYNVISYCKDRMFFHFGYRYDGNG